MKFTPICDIPFFHSLMRQQQSSECLGPNLDLLCYKARLIKNVKVQIVGIALEYEMVTFCHVRKDSNSKT